MTDTIKIVVSRERFEEVVSIDHAMYFQLTNKEAYDYMCHFVMTPDATSKNGKASGVNGTDSYLSVEDAREKFKKIPQKEFNGYVTQFMKAVGDAFVSFTKEGESDEPSSPE